MPPVLLIDKFASFDGSTAQLLDNHVWLNARHFKLLKNPDQTIAIGEAIQGISIVGSYLAKNGVEKYGLKETILIGSGIFVGEKIRNDEQATDLSAAFITDYDRHNDWILKLANAQAYYIDFNNQHEFNRLFTLPGHVTIRYQDSNINNYISRQIGKKKEVQHHANQKANTSLAILPKIKHLLLPKKPSVRYRGKFSHYAYFNDHEGNFIPIIILRDITDELNKPIESNFSFIVDNNVSQIGKLSPDEKVIFTTTETGQSDADHSFKLLSISPVNNKAQRAKLPSDQETFIGFVMFDRNDWSIEHLPFLEKYRAWAAQNNITLPKQENRKLVNLKSMPELLAKFNINEQNLNKLH